MQQLMYISRRECVRYWSLLKDTENLTQAASTAAELDLRTQRNGVDPLTIDEWTQLLEEHLVGNGIL